MSTGNATALVPASGQIVKYNEGQLQLIKDTYAKGATDAEFRLFVEVAERKGLDIFSRQVHLVKRWDSKLQREVMEVQTGIDGYRLMAERTGKYEGQLGPFWCGKDGIWKDVWLSNEPPSAAKVGVLKTNCKEPLWSVALFKEYAQTKKDGSLTQMWNKMGANQLAKCAEALALRKAFPSELAGIYTAEEMAQASNTVSYDADAEIVDSSPQQGTPSAPTAKKTEPEISDRETRVNDALLEYCKKQKGEKNAQAFFDAFYAKKSFVEREAEAKRLGLITAPALEAEPVTPATSQPALVAESESITEDDLDPKDILLIEIEELRAAATEFGKSSKEINAEITRQMGHSEVGEMNTSDLATLKDGLGFWLKSLREGKKPKDELEAAQKHAAKKAAAPKQATLTEAAPDIDDKVPF